MLKFIKELVGKGERGSGHKTGEEAEGAIGYSLNELNQKLV